eukprot:CAMPEP_0116564620 /NCGR_PEP_ID=MMETSP0397-20121206/13408_1 /TAXON_ID=216820 /ORGANISM="Cyclophora tenuis, Strain ECT3854" /LENGTH=68 /DNA_ID=CAMNT_0004091231 /DNA_START=108 /DNA_END=315 /DNA_ORIENTATION=-
MANSDDGDDDVEAGRVASDEGGAAVGAGVGGVLPEAGIGAAVGLIVSVGADELVLRGEDWKIAGLGMV